MKSYLLQLSIGPVQEFIAAARRTRDLWFGSLVLSEISKAAARAVRDHGGNLIFPNPEKGSDLAPDSPFNVANIILAELHGADPRMIARSAREAAELRWHEFADPVLSDCEGAIRADVWQRQVDDVVEFYSAWAPFTRATYGEKRSRLTRLMAGRKNCRDFQPGHGIERVPKSSLDGLRETVLTEDRLNWPRRLREGLRVQPGEQLDVVGLVKRRALGKQKFPSVSRVAADPWIRGILSKKGDDVLASLVQTCEGPARDLLTPLDCARLHPDYARFPFEGSAVYRQRHPELVEETSGKGDREDRVEQLRALSEALRPVERFAREAGLGAEPDPYLAVLVADGDRMGKALDEIARLASDNPLKRHGTFSLELARFAGRAADIVRARRGVLVYSGGDDVLAFVPVDQAIACARDLYSAFDQTMRDALQGLDVPTPTLSVGVAIAHFLENLEDLLDYGRKAEQDAKKDRDALAVHLHKRGGAPVRLRKPWKDSPDERLTVMARWFLAGAVSNRTPYELDRLAEVYADWPDATVAEAIQADAARAIDRKRPRNTDSQMTQVRQLLKGRVKGAADLRALAAELVVARHLAVALRQSGENP
jgi:CRISPR-associated protein Cmr2